MLLSEKNAKLLCHIADRLAFFSDHFERLDHDDIISLHDYVCTVIDESLDNKEVINMTIAEILDCLNNHGYATTDIDIEAYKQETDFFDKNTGDIIAVYHSTRGTLTIY